MTKGTGRQGFIFPLPHLQSLALPRALLQIYRAAALQGLKITTPIPLPSQLTPPTLRGTCRSNLGHFLPWMEDSHLLLELAARSAKQESLVLAHARHCFSCPSQKLGGGFGSPSLGQTGQGGTLDVVQGGRTFPHTPDSCLLTCLKESLLPREPLQTSPK